ncbi:D-isomer specific 2-hydroxyacid dehydrogenase NAD-binding [Caldivirga maquilingensis IC-167]|uniref:D-isomer specific 2-hydroxyacid dehydrogenase NAD-binding n=1 Tax=Caldivirga maquilingensis (strain ATCC 700844 / DSM 13496 / JCM 10307 / IC-167) TaxID=397948 RepID=A8MD25_CALMQ|nr:D-isomer specific 2-hydroxyacid dehydrogenase NAD-binding [Caldivirga maquilingensis IC-167]
MYLTRSTFPKLLYDTLRNAGFDLEVWDNKGHGMWDRAAAPPRDVLRDAASRCDALVVTIGDRVDDYVLSNAKVKVIATYSVGYDHIDLDAATRRGIPVGYTPEVLVEAVADLAIGLIITLARRVIEGDRLVRSGEAYKVWGEFLGTEVWGKTLGILGLGNIGAAVARRAKAFNMNVIYWSRTRKPWIEVALGLRYVDLNELFRQSDYLVLTVALSKETYHIVNEERLRLMKNTSYLVNVARGAVVDTNALVKALKEGWIAGAALDVYEEEPIPNTHELIKLNNVILTPHIASATVETRNKMAEVTALNVINVLLKNTKPVYQANMS